MTTKIFMNSPPYSQGCLSVDYYYFEAYEWADVYAILIRPRLSGHLLSTVPGSLPEFGWLFATGKRLDGFLCSRTARNISAIQANSAGHLSGLCFLLMRSLYTGR